MAQLAPPNTTISTAVDGYVLIDSVPDYEKKSIKILITSTTDLLACIKLEKEQKCHLFIGEDQITIEDMGGREEEEKLNLRNVFGRTFKGTEVKIIKTEDLYQVKKLSDNLNMGSQGTIGVLLKKNITRTPLFSKLNLVPGFESSDSSMYLSGVKAADVNNYDKNAIDEQSKTLDSVHLMEIRNDYQHEFLNLVKSRHHILYVKDIRKPKAPTYKKVSFPKAKSKEDPVLSIYLNDIGGGKRETAAAVKRAEYNTKKAEKESEIIRMTAEIAEYNVENSKSSKTCATFSKVSESDLVKNAEAELSNAQNESTKFNAVSVDDYVKRELQFGEEITIDAFKKGCILIFSTKEWTVPGAPAKEAPVQEVSGANVSGNVETVPEKPKSWFGYGGRRRTKRNNKKSRKGKSKKQKKSRKLFKGIMY